MLLHITITLLNSLKAAKISVIRENSFASSIDWQLFSFQPALSSHLSLEAAPAAKKDFKASLANANQHACVGSFNEAEFSRSLWIRRCKKASEAAGIYMLLLHKRSLDCFVARAEREKRSDLWLSLFGPQSSGSWRAGASAGNEGWLEGGQVWCNAKALLPLNKR